MYRFFSRPKTQGSSYVAILSFATLAYAGMIALSPQKTESIDSRVFVEGVTIHLNHNSPPVAALEDILIDDELSEEKIPTEIAKTHLFAGLVSMSDVAEKIIATNESVQQPMQVASVPASSAAPKMVVQTSHVRNIDLRSVGVTREQLLDALFIPVMNNDPATVNRGGQMRLPASGQTAQRLARNFTPPPAASTQQSDGRVITPRRTLNQPAALVSEVVESHGYAPNSDPARHIVLRGAVEMNQGLAFTSPNDRIVVFREEKGQQFEVGNVWTKEARFEIGVASTDGLLVAELRTPAGEVLGSGRATMDTSKILISLTPTTQGLVGRVIAANSSDEIEPHPIKSAKMMVDMIPHEFVSEAGGRFSDPNLVNQSTMILKTEKPGFLPGLSIVSAGDENVIPMYSNKMVTELLSLQNNSDKVNNPDGENGAALAGLKNSAIVWGRVTRNGEAVAGGQVEMLTADQNVRAVYFNKMMIPDLSLTTTSANGYYAFVGVNPGVQALQVTYQSVLSEPSVIPTDVNNISQLNIDVARTKEANAIVFDAFHTEKTLQASILRLGQTSGQETDISGQAKLRYAEGTGLMILDVDAGAEYEMMRLTLNRSKNTIYAPVVTQAWFENLRKSAGLDEIAYTGSIMGFIQVDHPYKAMFGDHGADASKVVYFNSRGEIINGDVGEPGGGFVIFNAPEGLLTISVVLQGSEKILTQAVYVERNVVSSFSHWFH